MDKTNEINDLNIDQLNEEELLDSEESLEQDFSDESVDEDSEVARLRSENKKLVEIIKRRKEKDQKSDSLAQKPLTSNINPQIPSRDEIFLVAQGYSEEDIDQLHAVAKGTGLSLKEAKEHPLFTAYIEKVKADKRAKKASLGASRGSSTKQPVVTSGMTEEDHKKLWKEKMGLE